MFCNNIHFGDCLDVMRDMENESVDLIYLDPPFNKGRNFSALFGKMTDDAKFQDRWSWKQNIKQEWVDKIEEDKPYLMNIITSIRSAQLDSTSAYMCFMAVRLLDMNRVLKSTGTIYLHCDPTASHYLKIVMDAIFGQQNFRNEIVWCYTGGSISRKDFAKKHDVIFRYALGEDFTFNVDEVRIPYSDSTNTNPMPMARSARKGRVYDAHKPHPKGKHPEDWWTIQPLGAVASERTGYPTQKPLVLLERIIKASSNEGDLVLDPFCGSGTTLVASENLQRKWIGIDINEQAYKIANHRLRYKRGLQN